MSCGCVVAKTGWLDINILRTIWFLVDCYKKMLENQITKDILRPDQTIDYGWTAAMQ